MFYFFKIDVPAPVSAVAEKLRAIVRTEPAYGTYLALWKGYDESALGSRTLVGSVRDSSFKIRRIKGGKNSFLPEIWGTLDETPTGTQIKIKMFMDPVRALVLIFILAVGVSVVLPNRSFFLGIWGVIFLALAGWSFSSEVLKARHLLTAAVLDSTEALASQGSSPR